MRHFFPVTLILLIAAGGLGGCGSDGGGGSSGGGSSDSTDDSPGVFRISGEITVPQFTAVDSDTGDTSAGTVAQNDFSSAQRISNPSVVGGYVSNRTGTYSSGFSFVTDTTDVFLATLISGQTVTVDSFSADSDDFSTDMRVSLVLQSSETTESFVDLAHGESKTLTAATSADYYIRIEESQGPSTYVLSVGSNTDIAGIKTADSEVRPDADFVPGEAIVQYRSGISPSAVNNEPLPGYFLNRMTEDGSRGLFRFTADSAERRIQALSKAEQRRETLDKIEALRQRADVEWAEPNYIRRATSITPTDPQYSRQWHYPQINLPTAWEESTGSGVIVAVLDTGVLLSHPDLAGRLTGTGYDFVSSVSAANDGDGIDSNPDDPGDSLLGGSSFHGTHVAGTVAAAANNGEGGVGVAYSSQVMPVRVLGLEGNGTDSDLIQGIRYAARLSNSSGTLPPVKADIINMSLGGTGFSTALGNAVADAIAAGVIVVAAAGNENSSVPNYPAAYPGVISVSATGRSNARAPYSNFGSTVDVAAPGGDISTSFTNGVYSTWGDDSSGTTRLTYAYFQGTSMATPHVAGVLALMKSITNAASQPFTSTEANSFLQSGEITNDLGAAGRDDIFGYGLIDAAKAVVKAGAEIFPTLSADVSTLTFTNSSSRTINLTVPSGVSAIVESESQQGTTDWLSITEDDPDTFTVTVDDTGLADGVSYPGEIVFTYTSTKSDLSSTTKTLTIPVALVLADPDASADAGRHYILMVDEVSVEETQGTPDQDIYQTFADAVSGTYNFSINQIPEGSYILVAGSDADNDGFICDEGEACGYFPIQGRPEIITLDENKTGLVFTTSFGQEVTVSNSSAVSVPASGFPRSGSPSP